jgi:hypothetical protein
MPLIENEEMLDYTEPPPLKGNLLFKCVKIKTTEGGSPMIEAECIDDTHPEFLGQKIWEFIPTNLGEIENDIAQRIAKQTLFTMGQAFDVNPSSFDPETFVGKEFRAIITQRLDKRDGTMRPRVSKYMKA